MTLCFACACQSSGDVQRSEDAGAVDASEVDAGAVDAGRPASYLAVHDIFMRSCSYARCHSGSLVGGSLQFPLQGDYASALVDIPSCQYPDLPRVAPGDPERSWLMIKLTAQVRPKDDPLADYILFEPETGWDASKRGCRDEEPDGKPLFGQRMPLTAPNLLPDAELAAIREWIREGAPH